MKKTISDVLKIVDSLKPSTYDTTAKLQWLNEVDGNIWTELFKYKTNAVIPLGVGVSNYNLPADADYNRITQVYVNDVEIPKLSKSQFKTTGILMGTGNTVDIYPVPQEVGSMNIIYLQQYTPHESESIVTDTVLAESPFDKIYFHYISALIDFNRHEYDSYNNMLSMFNQSFTEYAEWLVKNEAIERSDWNCNSLLQNIISQSKKK